MDNLPGSEIRGPHPAQFTADNLVSRKRGLPQVANDYIIYSTTTALPISTDTFLSRNVIQFCVFTIVVSLPDRPHFLLLFFPPTVYQHVRSVANCAASWAWCGTQRDCTNIANSVVPFIYSYIDWLREFLRPCLKLDIGSGSRYINNRKDEWEWETSWSFPKFSPKRASYHGISIHILLFWLIHGYLPTGPQTQRAFGCGNLLGASISGCQYLLYFLTRTPCSYTTFWRLYPCIIPCRSKSAVRDYHSSLHGHPCEWWVDQGCPAPSR